MEFSDEEYQSLMKLTPLECYKKVHRPYSENLHQKIMKWIEKDHIRIYHVEYVNPLMKHHKVIAYIRFIDGYGCGKTMMSDDPIILKY